MAKGGKQPGAGRPLGATTRPQLRDYLDEKEIKALVVDLKRRAKTDDNLFKFYLEQIFGKAPQSIALSNPDGTNLFKPSKEEMEKIDKSLKDNE